MARFVTIKKCAELTGYTEAAIRGKIQLGIWSERAVWIKAPDGRILINMEGYDLWAESQSNTMGFESPQLQPLKSTSTMRGNGVKSGSNGSPRLPT